MSRCCRARDPGIRLLSKPLCPTLSHHAHLHTDDMRVSSPPNGCHLDEIQWMTYSPGRTPSCRAPGPLSSSAPGSWVRRSRCTSRARAFATSSSSSATRRFRVDRQGRRGTRLQFSTEINVRFSQRSLPEIEGSNCSVTKIVRRYRPTGMSTPNRADLARPRPRRSRCGRRLSAPRRRARRVRDRLRRRCR